MQVLTIIFAKIPQVSLTNHIPEAAGYIQDQYLIPYTFGIIAIARNHGNTYSLNWSAFEIKYLTTNLTNRSAELEWPSGLQRHACCVRHGWSWVRAPNLHQCLWTCLQVCRSKWLGYHADLYTVSRCHTEVNLRITQARKHKKGSILALKPRVDVNEGLKQRYQWPHEKDLCPQKKQKNQKKTRSHHNHCWKSTLLILFLSILQWW